MSNTPTPEAMKIATDIMWNFIFFNMKHFTDKAEEIEAAEELKKKIAAKFDQFRQQTNPKIAAAPAMLEEMITTTEQLAGIIQRIELPEEAHAAIIACIDGLNTQIDAAKTITLKS